MPQSHGPATRADGSTHRNPLADHPALQADGFGLGRAIEPKALTLIKADRTIVPVKHPEVCRRSPDRLIQKCVADALAIHLGPSIERPNFQVRKVRLWLVAPRPGVESGRVVYGSR